jgi:ketosteroid isomerase-like protein
MKKILALLLTTLLVSSFFIACKNSNNSIKNAEDKELTTDEKEVIKKAISNQINIVIQGAKELNVDKAASVYSDDATFKIVNSDATVNDFATMKKAQGEGFKGLKSLNFSTIKQDFTFLSKDLVMCTWTGINEFELTSGEKMKIEPYVGSLLFKNKDGVWKIIYAHETTATLIPVK